LTGGIIRGVERPRSAVIFGARNVGRAIAERLVSEGWHVVAMARTQETLETLPAGVRGEVVDAADQGQVAAVLDRAAALFGSIDLIVNAMTSPPRDQPFGGGAVADAPPGRLDEWLSACLPPAWNTLQVSGRLLSEQRCGTLVQVAGPSTLRVSAERGPWGAAQMALRGVVEAMVRELRPLGIHVALLIADGEIKTDRYDPAGKPPQTALVPGDIAHAVSFLEGQAPTGWTSQLVVTPPGRDPVF
jgi:NAD(P)-dependent dehydrogenase (short-subunit alcohol dehydrogenase family)